MNYINSSVSHWFVFCEALYLYRLLRGKAYKDRVYWYILTGWCKLIFKIIDILNKNIISSSTTLFNNNNLYNTVYIKKRFIYMLV